MKYKVVVEKRAVKFIRKQQHAQQKRILEALAQLPFVGDIKPIALLLLIERQGFVVLWDVNSFHPAKLCKK